MGSWRHPGNRSQGARVFPPKEISCPLTTRLLPCVDADADFEVYANTVRLKSDVRRSPRPVKPKLKKWLIRSALVLGLLVLVGYGFRDFWLRQLRAYALGLAEIRAEEWGYRLPDVDEIEVLSLDGFAPDSTPPADSILGYRIHARATLRAEQSNKIAELWRYQRRGRVFSATCHSPGYALRFRQHGKLLFETTVCWDCHNYTLPLGILGRMSYGFDTDTKYSKELLELLQTHAPLPKKPSA